MTETAATHPPPDLAAYFARLRDQGFWRPLLAMVESAARLDLKPAALAHPLGTCPTFVGEMLVVKLYSEHVHGRATFQVERAVLEALAATAVPAPRLIAAGELSLADAPYWYLVMTRVEGRPLSVVGAELSRRDKRIAAGVLGDWVSELHSLPVQAQVLAAGGSYRSLVARRRKGLRDRLEAWGSPPTALPAHAPLLRLLTSPLAPAAPEFIERWLPAEGSAQTVLVHGDIHADHLLGAGLPWRPAALIDFGDARSADRLYELGPLVTGTLDGDPALLDEFLAGYGWEIEDREVFARRALATALLHDFDMSSGWRERIASIKSLDELAMRLFSTGDERL